MKNAFHFSTQMALEKLEESPYPFAQLFLRGTLEVEVYKPVTIDKQQPHSKDEWYVIISGNAMFFHEGNTFEVKAGDALFVRLMMSTGSSILPKIL